MPTAFDNMKNEYLRVNRFVAMFIFTPEHFDSPWWFEQNLAEVSLPTVTFAANEWWDGTAFNRSISKVTFGESSMSFYMQDTVTNPFYDLVKRQAEFTTSQFQPGHVYNKDLYRFNVEISHLSGRGENLGTWQLYNCQIMSASVSQLTYQSEGGILMGSLTVLPDRVVLPGEINNSLVAQSSSDNQLPASSDSNKNVTPTSLDPDYFAGFGGANNNNRSSYVTRENSPNLNRTDYVTA
jgi:hypothetical protein